MSIGYCKHDVTQVRWQWSSAFLALTYRYVRHGPYANKDINSVYWTGKMDIRHINEMAFAGIPNLRFLHLVHG